MNIKSELTGRIVFPGDADYDAAREDFNLRFNKYPLAIVFCQNVQDVQNAVNWAVKNNIPLRARCGRHSYEGFSLVNGGIIIDVSEMNKIDYDRYDGTATIQAGARLLEIYEALWEYGVTIPGGTCPTVGISGIVQGGGFGMLTRKMGLLCDNLVGVEMVDASGNIIHADNTRNADLFWALCGGGGGNFCIVTSFTFKVHAISEVTIFNINWSFRFAEKVIEVWRKWAPYTDYRLTSILRLFTPDVGYISSMGEFIGPKNELQCLLEPLVKTGAINEIDIITVPYINAVYTFGGIGEIAEKWGIKPSVPHEFKETGAYVYKSMPSEGINTMIKFMRKAPNYNNSVEFQALAGNVKRVPYDATAYFHRNALFNLHYKAQWDNCDEKTENIQWVEAFRNEMLRFSSGDYVNFPDLLIKDWPKEYYGSNFERLRKIKTKYDNCNVFNFQQSIPPI